MNKQIVFTEKAPKPIGPYSQAVRAGDLIFTAGQLGFDPVTMEFVAGGIEEQTRQALANIASILEAAGTDMSRVVKCAVFLKDLNDFAKMNGVYASVFNENPPARTTVGGAGLPKNALVEIECVALAS
jgi:2-iminobutanoate/2-iminopropanoate deaminase